ADVVVEVIKKQGKRTFKIEKAKDDQTGGSQEFKLEVVHLGIDDDGDAITSCVVLPAASPPMSPQESPENPKVPKGARDALAVLEALIRTHGETPPETGQVPDHVRKVVKSDRWKEAANAAHGGKKDASRTAFKRAVKELTVKGLIQTSGLYVYLLPQVQ